MPACLVLPTFFALGLLFFVFFSFSDFCLYAVSVQALLQDFGAGSHFLVSGSSVSCFSHPSLRSPAFLLFLLTLIPANPLWGLESFPSRSLRPPADKLLGAREGLG